PVDAVQDALPLLLDAPGDEDAALADDRRRVPGAGQRGLPLHVLGRAPFEREAGVGDGAVGAGAAPPGPVLGTGDAGAEGAGGGDGKRVGVHGRGLRRVWEMLEWWAE